MRYIEPMIKSNLLIVTIFILTSCIKPDHSAIYWFQSSGPNANWKVESDQDFADQFSVRSGENILWTMDLPEVGQSGIAVWEDKIFLTVMKPLYEVVDQKELNTSTILALCIDANERKILWQKEIVGHTPSPYFYGFSDSTTPTPVTDGTFVWFFNASGKIVCYDMDGNQVWAHTWEPVEQIGDIHYPFNKQFEPVIHGDLLINMESYMEEDGLREYGWNYLYGLDKNTGEVKWISEDGLTHYCTPVFGKSHLGTPAMLIGRGAHHSVPETSKGYSLVDLNTGKTLWQYETSEGMAMYNAIWNQDYALWFTERENAVHKVDAKTGELIEKIYLNRDVTIRRYDTVSQSYKLKENFSFSDTSFVFPAWYTNIEVDDKLYFMCFKKTDGYRLSNVVPDYTFGRVDLNTKQVEYIEVPVQYDIVNGDKRFIWHRNLQTETKNIRELDVALDQRSKRDGWVWVFNGNPILVNDKLFFTTMGGMVYCIDTSAKKFDENALVSVNDLGPSGKTWSLNTPSFAEGKMYHRTSKHLICIGKNF
ncbi:MAG: PQQ-binding-like beta-propeller repeat protein [Cyclobacteriaceae bacterium]